MSPPDDRTGPAPDLVTAGRAIDARTLLGAVPLFSALAPGDIDALAQIATHEEVAFGATVVAENEPADALYVIADGHARVLTEGDGGDEVTLTILGAGDIFGEGALLGDGTRLSTVRATSHLALWRLDAAAFLDLAARAPGLGDAVNLQIRQRALEKFLRVQSRFHQLPAAAVADLLRALEPEHAAAGTIVIRRGDPPGSMYVVEEGKLVAYIDHPDGTREHLAFLRAGDLFGERALFTATPRHSTVEAVGPVSLLRLPESAFRRLLAEAPGFRELIETLVVTYDFRRTAHVPLDFADDLLPADAAPLQIHGETNGDGLEARSAVEGVGPTDTVDDDEASADDDAEDDDATDAPIKKFPLIRQVDEADCGVASLAMVCHHFGRPVSPSRVRRAVRAGFDGTSLRGLMSGAEELGLEARALKASASNLDRLPLPAIVHWQANHWIVAYRVDDGAVRVADPGAGLRTYSREEFTDRWTGYVLLASPTERFEALPTERNRYGWLWPLLKPLRGAMVVGSVLALLIAALIMLIPIATQLVVDRVLAPGDLGPLSVIIAGLGIATVVIAGATVLQRYLLGKAAVRADRVTLDHVTTRLLDLSMRYFYTRRVGDIQRRLVGMRQAREFLVQNGVRAVSAAAQLLVGLVLMFVYSPLLAGAFLVVAPAYVVLVRLSIVRMRPMIDDMEEAFGRYSSRQIDTIKGMETVKSLGAESYVRDDLGENFELLATRQFRVDFVSMLFGGAVQVLVFMSLAIFLWIGSVQVVNGTLSIGAFVSFNALIALSSGAIVVLMGILDELQYAAVLLDRLDDVFEEEPEQGHDHTGLRQVTTLDGRVTLDHLTFRYAPDAPAVLDDLSLDVPAGATVAIVGRSGSGKTTLLRCLAGLTEPTAGTIHFDGVDLATIDHRGLRAKLGIVLQESYVFSDTIMRNIAFGHDEPDLARVEWSARMASAHDFIVRLPLGYNTKVGESGLLLSGGQKQRLCIARALYDDPPILLLDEATSALDAESERAVRDNLGDLLADRTAFVIAHRIATVRDADLIIVLDRGRIAERGTHDELIARRGLYFYLSGEQLDL